MTLYYQKKTKNMKKTNNGTLDTNGQLQQPKPLVEITDKRGYAEHWSFSIRKCDQLLAKGMPHLKISARQIRISIPEADAWMRDQFLTQRTGNASSKRGGRE